MHDKPDKTLGFLIGTVGHLHHHRVQQLMDLLGLFHSQSRLMRLLWHEDGQSHSDLADKMEVTRATVTRLVQRAEKAGLVERKQDMNDQRISRVYLTKEGRTKREEVFATFDRIDEETFAGFDDEEREQIRALLERIITNLKNVTENS